MSKTNIKQLKYIHITKCAGSFIEDIGNEYNIKWGRFHSEYGYWHDTFYNKSLELKKKYDWFIVVRNPYDRILSEYYCQWGGIGKTDIKHSKKEFNNYLIKKIQNRSISGDHYTEQYKYIDNNTKINVVKFENLNEELNTLFNIYNIPIDVKKHKRQTQRKVKIIQLNLLKKILVKK